MYIVSDYSLFVKLFKIGLASVRKYIPYPYAGKNKLVLQAFYFNKFSFDDKAVVS